MLLLFLAAATTAAAPQPNPDKMPVYDLGASNPQCPPISRYEAARRGGKLKPELLDQLPKADVYKAVYRRVGGCVSPVIVRYGLGR